MAVKNLDLLEANDFLDMPEECHGHEFEFSDWHLRHGWAFCKCGLIWCIVDYDDDEELNGAECKIVEEQIEPIAEFYNETDERWDESDDWDEWAEENYPDVFDD